MDDTTWILVGIEMTGFRAPVFVVEIGGQKMCGWKPDGKPFRKLLNQGCDNAPEESRVHGYTREILERDGEPATEVYEAFREYAGCCPMVAYNAEYHLDQVLRPEWTRLGIAPIGSSGFCALRLAQRFLDPVPAGNCKLQTLRQYYRLPEHGAHTALGDVFTVADLFATVLRPIAEQRGLETWGQLAAYATEEWYPSRIAFGKHRGKSAAEARTDAEFRRWLDGMAQSANERNARMGRWYLQRLEEAEPSLFVAWECARDPAGVAVAGKDVVLYVNPELQRLRALVDAARARLAELEASLTVEKAKVDAMKARLFARLREYFQRRDRLRLVISYRRKYLESLVRDGEEDAAKIQQEYRQANAQNEQEYAETAAAMKEKKELSAEGAAEVTTLWRKLVKLFHPDRFAHEPEKLETYQKLTAAINHAKDNGDLATLRRIAEDPHGFILRQGWAALDFGEEREIAQLRRLWESIELEIIRVLETRNQLRESPDYELHQLTTQTPEFFDETVRRQVAALEKELGSLESQAEELAKEIEELTGEGRRGSGSGCDAPPIKKGQTRGRPHGSRHREGRGRSFLRGWLLLSTPKTGPSPREKRRKSRPPRQEQPTLGGGGKAGRSILTIDAEPEAILPAPACVGTGSGFSRCLCHKRRREPAPSEDRKPLKTPLRGSPPRTIVSALTA
jgi:DNA polymerase III epsilon subunit-like protein